MTGGTVVELKQGMKIRFHTILIALVAAASCGLGVEARLAAQGTSATPNLPAVPFDYVGHAVDNLPEHYLSSAPFGDAGASNNTPADNPISNAGATLGRVLFFDKRLSIDNSISCATCHTQATGFGDPRRFSFGVNGAATPRHSMALTNATFYFTGRFRWDETAETLEDQCLIPIEAAGEMALPLEQLRQRLADLDFYAPLFVDAFGDAEITDQRIAQSMAQFVRSMVSYDSKYDRAFAAGDFGLPDFEAVFNESELIGRRLFERTAESVGCHQCHASPAQIGDMPRNIGLDLETIDPGSGDGRFKVPSLRNVAVRGRFMHDGRFSTLAEVVGFYNSGIQSHPDLDANLFGSERLNLSEAELQGLVDFLETLTDQQFLNSPMFSDPFAQFLLGDVNQDGVVDLIDVPAFIDRLLSGLYQGEADLNGDFVVNLLDVAPLVELLIDL